MINLSAICDDIARIEESLMMGEISFSYDTLMTVMGMGHPAEILDDILSPVFGPVKSGNTIESDLVLKLYRDIIGFKNTFKVKELAPVIRNLEKYLHDKGIETSKPRVSHELLKKRYIGKTLDKDKFKKAGDVWNLEVKNGILYGHFYWNTGKRRFCDNFMIHVDDKMIITGIEKLDTWYADNGIGDRCRYTFDHNGEFDKLLRAATTV